MKTTIVVLGGLWYSPALYGEMDEYFRGKGCEVLIPDLTGKDLGQRVAVAYNAIAHLGDRKIAVVAHSFGAIVAHKLIELHPELNERIRCFVGLGAVSPYRFEPMVNVHFVVRYITRIFQEVFGREFRIPNPEAFAREFGGTGQDYRLLNSEPGSLLRNLIFGGFLGRLIKSLVSVPLSCPVYFINGRDDGVVTRRSLADWAGFYGSLSGVRRFNSLAGKTHNDVASNYGVMDEVCRFITAHHA